MFVAEPVELYPDNDGDVLHAVLPVYLLPAAVAQEMIPGNQRVLEAGHHSRRGCENLHFVDMVLQRNQIKSNSWRVERLELEVSRMRVQRRLA